MAILLALGTSAAGGPLGSVTGSVTLAGAPPQRAPLPVYKNREVCGDSVADDRLVVASGGGIRYAVVTIEGGQGGTKAQRDTTVVLDNRGCRFEPHVQTAEVGQWLELHNRDPVLHNADARIGRRRSSTSPCRPSPEAQPLARPGLVAITCDAHPWMSAFVAVTDHPYHAVTDATGIYEIRDLPAGTTRSGSGTKARHPGAAPRHRARAGGWLDFAYRETPGGTR